MAFTSMMGSIMQKLMDIVTGFFAIIPQSIYFLYASVGSLLDVLQYVVRKIAGLDVYYVNGANGLEEKTGDIVTDIIEGILGINQRYSALNTVFWSMIIFGVIVLFVMTIITIIKAHYNYDAKKSQPSYIIKTALKSIATMAIIPIMVLFGMYLSAALFQALDSITTVASSDEISEYYEQEAIDQLASATVGKGKTYSSYDLFGEKEWSNTSTFSGMLFNICAHDASRVRYGAYTVGSGEWDTAGLFYLNDYGSMSEEDVKEKVAQQIDFAFENSLTFASSHTIQLTGSESKSAIASSLTFGPSAVYAAGLVKVSHFSKFNVGLVWYYYNLWAFNFIIAFGAIAMCLSLLANMVFGMMMRMFILVVLFIVYPPIVGITPLDDGNAVKSWRSNFMSQAISAYTSVVSMNLFFMVLPLMRSISFFNNTFLDGLVSMILIIAGLTMVKKFIQMVSGFVGAKDIDEMGQGVRKDGAKAVAQGTTAAVKMAGASIGAARTINQVRKGISSAVKRNRNSKIYKLKKKQEKEGLNEKETKKLKRMEVNKAIHETPDKIKRGLAKAGKGIVKTAKRVKKSKFGKGVSKALDNDLMKMALSRFGIPIDQVPASAWVDHAVVDDDGNPVLDEDGNQVIEQVMYAKDKNGGIQVDDKGRPVIAQKKKSKMAILKDAMVDLTGMSFKAVGDISGVKKLFETQSGAIDAAKTKLNDLTKGIAALGGKKGLFKTDKMKEEEDKEKELTESTLVFNQTSEETDQTLKAITDLLESVKSKASSGGSGGGSGSGSGGSGSGGSGGGTPPIS